MAADSKDYFSAGWDPSGAFIPSGGATLVQGVGSEAVITAALFPGVALTPVSASRSTEWAVAFTPPATAYFDITGGVTSVNMPLGPQIVSTVPVSASRGTTWHVKSVATSTRPTTWDVRTVTTQTRPTTWDVLARITPTRSSTWDVLARITPTRATSWDTLARVTPTRATTWDVLSSVVPAERASTWNVLFTIPPIPIGSMRSTFWNVNRPAYRLIQQTGDEVWTLQLPTARYGIPRASTLLFKDGAVTFKQSPLDVELRAADWYVIGGHDDLLTEAQAADLTTAGYGSLLETV